MNRRAVAGLILIVALVVAGCSDSDDATIATADSTATADSIGDESATTSTLAASAGDGTGDAAVTTAAPTTAPTAARVTAPSTTAAVTTGALVGDWVADVGDVLATLTAPLGGAAPTCSGPYLLSFDDDGAFAARLEPVCVVGEIEATGVLGTTGTYTDDGTTFQVFDIVGEGNMSMGGVVTPLPIIDGLNAAFGLPSTYTIVGDVLEFSFTSPDGIDYTLQFQRAA